MFAGSLQGVTQTLPLAIYSQFEADFTTALAIGALLVVVSAACSSISQATASVDVPRSISPFPFARSTST